MKSALLLACLVLSGCAAKHASLLDYNVPDHCHVSLRLEDCDKVSPPNCKRIRAKYDRHCEELIAPKGKIMLPISSGGRRYGFKPSAPDLRDFGVSALKLTNPFALPASIDLESWCGPVFDQGDEGSCTANAGCGNFEFLLKRYNGRSEIFSRAFLYYKERERDGTLDEGDCGSFGRTACIVMRKDGVCLEADMPYRPGKFADAPSTEAALAASKNRAGAYHALHSVFDMKSCLASQYPFLIGFTVYESFESDWKVPGVMPLPDTGSELVLGGHEVLVIGYDDHRKAFKTRNSWGKDWALDGNFWFPYKAIADPEILSEAWIQHLGHGW
jgi:C1A family cysteine protease